MHSTLAEPIRRQLRDRRERLETALRDVGREQDLLHLLGEVDDALNRLDRGAFGQCEFCLGSFTDEELAANPIVRYCLCELSELQKRQLEADLSRAAHLQWSILPPPDARFDGWDLHYRARPAGPVSGDYLDVIPGGGDAGGTVLVGDVSGKGVTAALVMARLNALFRTLTAAGRPLPEMVGEAGRLLRESRVDSHYATLVGLRAGRDGRLQLVNAGHPPPLKIGRGGVEEIRGGGYPVGLLEGEYLPIELALQPGESLLIYTDGVTEARDAQGEEFGAARLAAAVDAARDLGPRALVARCLAALTAHTGGQRLEDDLTLLALRRDDAH